LRLCAHTADYPAPGAPPRPWRSPAGHAGGRVCAGLKGITTWRPLRSGAYRVRIKRCT